MTYIISSNLNDMNCRKDGLLLNNHLNLDNVEKNFHFIVWVRVGDKVETVELNCKNDKVCCKKIQQLYANRPYCILRAIAYENEYKIKYITGDSNISLPVNLNEFPEDFVKSILNSTKSYKVHVHNTTNGKEFDLIVKCNTPEQADVITKSVFVDRAFIITNISDNFTSTNVSSYDKENSNVKCENKYEIRCITETCETSLAVNLNEFPANFVKDVLSSTKEWRVFMYDVMYSKEFQLVIRCDTPEQVKIIAKSKFPSEAFIITGIVDNCESSNNTTACGSEGESAEAGTIEMRYISQAINEHRKLSVLSPTGLEICGNVEEYDKSHNTLLLHTDLGRVCINLNNAFSIRTI